LSFGYKTLETKETRCFHVPTSLRKNERRSIEPTSKADSLRVIEETGIAPVSYPTLYRRLPVFAKSSFRQVLRPHVRLMPGWGRPAFAPPENARHLHSCVLAVERLDGGLRHAGEFLAPAFTIGVRVVIASSSARYRLIGQRC
jgi:hypothetical protein